MSCEEGCVCWICSNGEAKFRDHIASVIESHQHIVLGIGGDEESWPFSYTIGNHGQGFAELLCTRFAGVQFQQILNVLCDLRRDRKIEFTHGEYVSLGGKFPVKIVNTVEEARTEFALRAEWYYGEEVIVKQVIMCDEEGCWPGDPRCQAPFSEQVILEQVHN